MKIRLIRTVTEFAEVEIPDDDVNMHFLIAIGNSPESIAESMAGGASWKPSNKLPVTINSVDGYSVDSLYKVMETYFPYGIVDTKPLFAKEPRTVWRCKTESDAVTWINSQPDQDRVKAGVYRVVYR